MRKFDPAELANKVFTVSLFIVVVYHAGSIVFWGVSDLLALIGGAQ